MTRMRSRLLCTGVFVLALVLWFAPVSSRCLEGTSVAAYQNDGPWRGFYLYTIELTFMLEKGLSNVTLKLNVDDCPELACQQYFFFPDPAGEMGGEDVYCPVPFKGEFNCTGNPSIGLNGPVVKWDAEYAENCEPGKTGTIRLYFYTNVGPDPESKMPFFLIKNGLNVCEGYLIGDTPGPACIVPAQESNWGAIKTLYE